MTLSLSLVTQDQWDPGIGNWHFLLTCRDKKWEEKNYLQDNYSNLIKSAALFLCRVPCCAFVPVCFFSRMLETTKRRNKRSSSTSFLHLPSKEIISASEMTSRKTAWNCLFFHFISACNHELETASRETRWLQTFCHTQSRQWCSLV